MGKKLTVDLWDLRLLGQRLRDRGIALDWPTFPPEKRSEEITEVRWDDPQRMLQGLPRSEPREIAILRYTLRLSAHPFDAEARYRRGLLLSMIDTPRAQAASLVDLSLAIGLGHPRSADAHHQRGHLYEQRRSWQEAAEDFTAAIAGLPEKRGHLFGVRGGCRLRQRRYADAVKDLGEAWPLTRDSNEHATVSRDLCHAYLVGKIEPPKEVNLVELARTAVGLEPDRGMHHVTLGLALHRAGKHREAVAAVDQSQKLPDHPTHGLGLVVRAAALARLGDMTEARASFDQAAAWRKKHPSLAPYLQAELDQFSEEASRASSR